jgi:YbbR-like protein
MLPDWRRNLPLKVLSLGLALFIWILTTSEIQKVKDLTVPLQYTGLPHGMVLGGDAPDRVSLRIQAPEPILQRITEDQVDAHLDLSDLPGGDQVVTLTPDRFHVSGAEIIRVEPRILPVRLVRQAERELSVVPRLEGKPPEGYEVVDYRVDPPTVVVVGPEDAVREVRRATTGSISVQGLTSSREVVVHPVPEGDAGSPVRLRDPDATVKVRIGVREKRLERVLRDVPVHARGNAHRARLHPEAIDVKVAGPASVVGALDRGNVLVEVELEGLSPRLREYRVTPRILLVGIPRGRDLELQSASRTVAVAVEAASQETP